MPFLKQIAAFAVVSVCSAFCAFGQDADASIANFEQSLEQSKVYVAAGLYAESVDLLNEAQALAEELQRDDLYTEASIELAEVLRITEQFDQALELLRELKQTHRYPTLHVRKLGRLAALYSQGIAPETPGYADSLTSILNRAIVLASANGITKDEALLRNELGFYLSRHDQRELGRQNLELAAQLFEQIEDTVNQLGALTNLLDMYVGMNDIATADSLWPLLYDRVRGNNWWGLEGKLSAIISMRHKYMDDSLQLAVWVARANIATVQQQTKIYNDKLAAYRIIHDVEKVRSDLRTQGTELKREQARARELYIGLAVLLAAMLIVVLLWFRERNLKRELNNANEAYHMLILESNHRIKNNLQMITSMLRYSGSKLDPSQQKIVKGLAAKVETIGALHKHLYVEVHNELIEVETFFNEIVQLYNEIAPPEFKVAMDVKEVRIRSERIVYFGLVFNELLSNTIEHSPQAVQQIKMNMRALESGKFEFVYSDGAQWPGNLKPGTGVTLIRELIKRIGGSNEHWDYASGTVRFEFDPGKAGKRVHPLLNQSN